MDKYNKANYMDLIEKKGYKEFKDRPIIGKLCHKVDLEVNKNGLKQAIQNLINRNKTIMKKVFWDVEDKENVLKILKNQPVLVIANHEKDSEIIPLLASLPEREDIYIIAATELMGIGNNISKHIIPIQISKEILTKSKKFSMMIGRYFCFCQKFNRKKTIQKNIESLNKAASLLKSGAMIILFPSGVKGGKYNWGSGIGHLLSYLSDTEKEINYIQTYIEGASNLDFFRGMKKIGKILPAMGVRIAEPQRVKNILAAENHPKKLSKKLENEYYEWKNKIIQNEINKGGFS